MEQQVFLSGFEWCHVGSAATCPALPVSSLLTSVLHKGDQHPSSAVSGLVSFGTSDEDVADDDITSDDITADNSVSLVASVAGVWEGSGEEPKTPPSALPVRLKLDAELICILSKAVEDSGLEWSTPEKHAHGLLDLLLPSGKPPTVLLSVAFPVLCLQFTKSSLRHGAPLFGLG